MAKVKVLHQVLDLAVMGGISTEYKALIQSDLSSDYDFSSMILKDFHRGVSVRDVKFYYDSIRRENPDIIHVRGSAADGLNAVIAAKLARKGKVLVTVHGMYSDLVYIHPLKKWISKYVIEKLIYGLADGISCVCKTANDRPYFDKYRRKMLPYVYNRMPVYQPLPQEEKRQLRARYGIPEEAVVGLFVGRMTKEKGLACLVDAFRILDEEWPEDLYVMIVGDGHYRAEMEQACGMLKHGDRVCFCGAQSHTPPFLQSADFFIQPSFHENLSIAILEACAAGLPCLVTNVGGNTEIITDHVTGIVIPKQDAAALHRGLVQLCDKDTRLAMAENVRTGDFERFFDASVDRQLDSVYRQLLETT